MVNDEKDPNPNTTQTVMMNAPLLESKLERKHRPTNVFKPIGKTVSGRNYCKQN